MLTGIILFIIVLMVLVAIHELGHFLAARMFGVKVYEFGLGIPPKAKELFTDKKGTTYTLNWLPIGGFVRLKGEQPPEDGVIEEDSLVAKPVWQQVIILIAGIVFNVIFAGILFGFVLMGGFSPSPHVIDSNPQSPLSRVQYESVFFPPFQTEQDLLKSEIILPESMDIVTFLPNGAAYAAGLRDGDIIVGINNETIETFDQLRGMVALNKEGVPLSITKQGSDEIYEVTPVDGLIGVYLDRIQELKQPFFTALVTGLGEGWNQTILTIKLTVVTIGDFLFGGEDERTSASQSVGGPVAIGGAFVSIANDNFSWVNVFLFAGMISVALASFNVLPIPALDGGRILTVVLFGVYTKLTGRKITPKIEASIHGIGMLLLLFLAILVSIKDVANLL